jgi:D-alanine-D-alanine ligase
MHREQAKEKRIAVLMGGKSSEREISLRSGEAVLGSLLRTGHLAVGIDVAPDLPAKLTGENVEVAFIALHGKWGEDGAVQGLLEMMNIPYTGSGVLGSSMAMDKAIMKLLLTSMEIPTPVYAIYTKAISVDFPLPFVVKPANQGSTIGISIVQKEEEIQGAVEQALRYDKKLLVERYIRGDEITVGVVNGEVLPVVQVRPAKGFYDYEAKYTPGMTEYVVPAAIAKTLERRAWDIALQVYAAFDLSGCVRIDMLAENGIPHVIDINTSPGMTETSLVPKAWVHLGKTFDELIEKILTGAALKT